MKSLTYFLVSTPLIERHPETPIEEVKEDPVHRQAFLGSTNRVESAEEVIEC